MKKNTMMRIASILLIAVLLSTSAISGTYAKYVSSASASTSARVAKWGVEFVTHSNDLFKPEYDYKTVPAGVIATFSVEANTDVVAPGTSGSGYDFSTAHPMGDPEVSYVVTFKVNSSETVSLTEGADTYYPIKYTLMLGTTKVVDGSTDLSATMAWLESCQYMFDVDNKQYYISTDNGANWTSHTGIPALDLSWEWEYEVDDATDVKDSKLGNLAAGYTLGQVGADACNLEIAFNITATAEQID